jgi:hypothetical protein
MFASNKFSVALLGVGKKHLAVIIREIFDFIQKSIENYYERRTIKFSYMMYLSELMGEIRGRSCQRSIVSPTKLQFRLGFIARLVIIISLE